MARSTMANLIARVRSMINDPSGLTQTFADDDIQAVLDASRQDVRNQPLTPKPTYSGNTLLYLDYYANVGDWEDGVILKQYLTTVVTPSLSENLVGHWQFSDTTLPPVAITGSTYDIYRAAADLLERMAAKWVLRYSFSADGQNMQRGQVTTALQQLAATYRRQQRAVSYAMTRSDIAAGDGGVPSLRPTELDYMGQG